MPKFHHQHHHHDDIIEESTLDVDLIVVCLQNCVDARSDNEGRLATDHYLCAFNQLIRLFKVFGAGCFRPLKDLPRAVRALEFWRVSGTGAHYRRMSSMLQHERDGGGVHCGPLHLMSGTKALSHLDDALPYMAAFLQRLLLALSNQGRFSGSVKVKVYMDTLGKDRSLMRRTADKLALLRSPSASQMLEKIEQHCHGNKAALQVLRDLVEAMQQLHKETLKVVTDHGSQ
ncbi:hypothetical protein CAPTEDRAFT_189281 [Capitella teleta]|uniref:Glycolipid transfer protein domain-containing protein n=1 Tax=Capitella teleta TaxID=283909 RepID=R7URW1_CAPTE|nr:hypothetical protein CAPTEDRAFT_189281 [Capitella teleta]|eukprot:ELU06647.1 hypothetical protein CAPTEDRAFT_189281 [Capitella teleta]